MCFVVDSDLSTQNHNRKVLHKKIHGVAVTARKWRKKLLEEYQELKEDVRDVNAKMLTLAEKSEELRTMREIFSDRPMSVTRPTNVTAARATYSKM